MSNDHLKKKIFDDTGSTMVVWQTLMDRAYSHLRFSLETTRFYFLLISALLTIYAVIIAIEIETFQSPWKIISLVIISVFMIFFAKIGLRTLKRQYSRFLEFVAYLAKVEEIIGLSDPKKTEIFREDEYLFDRFVKRRKKYNSSEKFIKGELKKKGSLYQDVKSVYRVLMLIGGALTILALSSEYIGILIKFVWESWYRR